MNQKQKPILITGGHSTPAFAVLEELISRGEKDFLWVGEKYNQRGNKAPSAEYTTVTQNYKIKFINLESGKLVRNWSIKTFVRDFFEFIKIFLGLILSLIIINKYKPKAVVSFGGFTAVPIVISARIFKIPVLTHEQTVTVGLANKIISKFANKICISWKKTENKFPKNKVVFTGNPIRKAVFEIKSNITESLDSNLPILYITGGNQGANNINKRIIKIIDELLEITNVIHQTGNSTVTNDYKKAMLKRDELDIAKKNRYIVKDYVNSSEIGEVMNKADLIFARSGANTISEVLALGKLCILMPIPWASGDEQTKNAKLVEEIGLAKRLIQQNSLTSEEILKAIKEGLVQHKKNLDFKNKPLDKTIQDAKQLITFNSSQRIVDELFKLINK